MKAILIVTIVVVVAIFGAFFAGQQMATQNHKIDSIGSKLSSEHKDILDALDTMANKTDTLDAKMDRIENKLDILVKIATSPQGYVQDTRR
jgi:predicted PurR-regulated permease PerM